MSLAAKQLLAPRGASKLWQSAWIKAETPMDTAGPIAVRRSMLQHAAAQAIARWPMVSPDKSV